MELGLISRKDYINAGPRRTEGKREKKGENKVNSMPIIFIVKFFIRTLYIMKKCKLIGKSNQIPIV